MAHAPRVKDGAFHDIDDLLLLGDCSLDQIPKSNEGRVTRSLPRSRRSGELDDSKRKLVVAMLRPGAPEPEERELPKDAPHISRLFRRLEREGTRAGLLRSRRLGVRPLPPDPGMRGSHARRCASPDTASPWAA